MAELDEFSAIVHAEVDAALALIGPAVIALERGHVDLDHPSRFHESPEYVFAEIGNPMLVMCLVSMAGASGKFEEAGFADALLVSELIVDAISQELMARLAGLDPDNAF